jgi:hypothetical protein
MRWMMRRVGFMICLLLVTPAVSGWSNKEHIQMTRIAALRLIERADTPEEMKQWLRDVTPDLMDMEGERNYLLYQRIGIIPRLTDGVAYWSVMPDMVALTEPRSRTVAPYGVHERVLHYIDVEFFHPEEEKRSYRHDLSHKPRLEDIPRDMTDDRYQRAGMLPFRVEESYGKLVEMLREGRMNDEPGQYPRDEHAAKWAGYLAHYVQDNTQPHHSTIDYMSRSYFADGVRAPNVHTEMEYRMPDDNDEDYMELRREFWEQFMQALEGAKDPVQTGDLWEETVQVALISYDALPLIGMAAMEAAAQGGTPDEPRGRAGRFETEKFFRYRGDYRGEEMTVSEMKAHQMAWAVARTERLWRQAWDEAKE